MTDVLKLSHSYLDQATALAVLLPVFFMCSSIIILGSLSLLSDTCQRRNLESWLGGHGLVGEWFVGCVGWCVGWLAPPLRPTTTNISLLSDAHNRTNLAWWAGGYMSVGVDWWVCGLLGASVGA